MRTVKLFLIGCLCTGLLGLAGADFTPLAGDAAKDIVAAGVYEELAASSDGTAYVIVMLRPVKMRGRAELALQKAEVADIQTRVLAGLAPDEFEPIYIYKTIPAMFGRVNSTGLLKLAVDPEVRGIGTDLRGRGTLNNTVPFINANTVHNNGGTGQGITVAVLDTGMDMNHSDLSDNIAAGAWHFLNQGANQGPGAQDDNGHGTNVSGIITSKGVVASVGVAPDADILAVKVLDQNSSGWLSDWTAGVDYVVANAGNYSYLCAINMSLASFALYNECPCDNANIFNQALGASIAAAKAAGIVTFAASGNNGSCTSMGSPACLSAATAVAAVYDLNYGNVNWGLCTDTSTFPDKITCFTNRSSCNELAGPGVSVTAPGWPGGGTSTFSGTSQATPHCAGVAALMCEAGVANNVSLTPNDIVQFMKNTGVSTTDPCGTTPNPIRVDALAAVTAVQTVPVFVTSFDARIVASGIELRWDLYTDEALSGINLYKRTEKDGREITVFEDPSSQSRAFVDRDVRPGETYFYALGVVTSRGAETRSPLVSATARSFVTVLDQNFPNPFNPTTTIAYTLGEEAHVTLSIYDSRGKLIVTLEDRVRSAGSHEVAWDGRDSAGNYVGSGVYFYRLDTGGKTQARKMLLLK